MSRRKLWVPVVLGAGSFIGTVVYRRRSVRTRTRLDVVLRGRLDGVAGRRIAGRRQAAALRPRRAGGGRRRVSRSELGARLLERAYLEGDFVLRSGRRSKYYLDKYRFETDPELLAGIGRELAAMVAEHAPGAELLAGPELGAVPLAAVTSIQSGVPYVIVRKEAKEYGTAKRLEGVYEAGQTGVRGRGRGHFGRRAAVCGRGAAGRRPPRFRCNLRGRPRGGGRRRDRRGGRALRIALHCFLIGHRRTRPSRPELASLSRLSPSEVAGRVSPLNPFRPRNRPGGQA